MYGAAEPSQLVTALTSWSYAGRVLLPHLLLLKPRQALVGVLSTVSCPLGPPALQLSSPQRYRSLELEPHRPSFTSTHLLAGVVVATARTAA